MNTIRIPALCAVAIAAMAGSSAHAVVTYTAGDLLMGFRATGGQGSGTSYVVNIGAASGYRDGTAGSIALGNIGQDLETLYGANWSTRTDLQWGIAGTPSSSATVGGDPADTLYVSKGQSVAGTPGSSFTIASEPTRGLTANFMNTLQTTFATYAETANSTAAALQPDAANTWRNFMNGGTSSSASQDFSAFSNIETTPDKTLSLFRIDSSSPGSYEGYFRITQNGTTATLTFSPVPEPASLVLGGMGGLLLAFRRRRLA